jgi:hypothetical protein
VSKHLPLSDSAALAASFLLWAIFVHAKDRGLLGGRSTTHSSELRALLFLAKVFCSGELILRRHKVLLKKAKERRAAESRAVVNHHNTMQSDPTPPNRDDGPECLTRKGLVF